jgi:AGZA family xanthine/uracil permease-like MFS transporter
MLSRLFELDARQTSIARELRGGLATFLTMAYILFANPAILSSAGVPRDGAVVATALSAALCCVLMGLGANAPIALAPGMGLNAVVAFQLTAATGSWQAAMGLVVIEGLVVLALVLLGLREAVVDAIPIDLRRAIAVGIGLFIAFIGAVNARLVVVPRGTIAALAANPSAVLPPVTFGSLRQPESLIALIGVIVIAMLLARGVKGALLIGIAVATGMSLILGVAKSPQGPWLQAPSFGTFFQADLGPAFRASAIPLVLSLVMVDFFDTIGTATAIGEAAGLADAQGRLPRLKSVLAIDAASASIGGVFGASSVTSYVESAAGVAEGARTGLHTVFVGLLFLAAALAAPVAAFVPAAATAPALLAVGFLMAREITRIDFRTFDTAVPAFLTVLLVPLTWSIAHGIGYGFIAHVAMRLGSGRPRDVHPLMYGTAAAFIAYFVLAGS